MTINDVQLRKSGTYYSNLKQRLLTSNIYNKKETIDIISPIWQQFMGKSGNRKLICHDMQLYKSILHYGKEFDCYLKIKSFSVYLKIVGQYKCDLQREQYCRCGKRICWDAVQQEIKIKGYCKKCHITPNRKDHFKYTYGPQWEKFYTDYHQSEKMQNIYAIKGRILLETKLLRHGVGFINKGVRETPILNYYETVVGHKIDRQFKVLKYFPDGYCKETNTVFEVYEYHHLFPYQIKKDIIRQQKIQQLLNCNFVIIYDLPNIELNKLDVKTYANTT